MNEPIKSSLISIRDLAETDIPLVLDYWFNSPSGFLEAMGVDLAKMPSRTEMEVNLREKCRLNAGLSPSKLTALTIMYENQAVGVHTMHPLVEGDFGVFHAHLWKPEARRRGIGMHSYPQACRIFMERFDLKRILFKTPRQNTGAIRVKEKLGIRSIGEEVIEFSIIRAGTLARVFELTRAEALSLCL